MNSLNTRAPSISLGLAESYERDAYRLFSAYGAEYGSPVSLEDVLRAHYVVVDFTLNESLGEGIGGIGPRDDLLLVSALDRQSVSLGATPKWERFEHQIATLIFGLVKNHPFHDANKRTALLVLVNSCYRHGLYLESDKSETEDLLVYLAANALHLMDGYEEFADLDDPEVNFVADYIRRNTRNIDKRTYIITYRELESRLRRHGFALANPDNNYIDIVKAAENRRVMRTGFPGWSRQVAKGDIKRILESCELDAAHGVDSEVFFRDEDPIYFFASDYRAQIASLALR